MFDTKNIPSSWLKIIEEEFAKPYFVELQKFVESQQKAKTVFPPSKFVFSALKNTPFAKVKVVLIGQDPYHGEGQANGLAFSVKKGLRLPPSLRNIFKELHNDAGCELTENGDLTKWSKQGVLLLNTVLTVNKSEPNSHKNKGWEVFTDLLIEILSEKKKGLVFLLWGNHAKEKKRLINKEDHLVLEAAHPSPFSAHNGFFGCSHFSKVNAFLESKKKKTIDWCLND